MAAYDWHEQRPKWPVEHAVCPDCSAFLSSAELDEHWRIWADTPLDEVPPPLCDPCVETWWDNQGVDYLRVNVHAAAPLQIRTGSGAGPAGTRHGEDLRVELRSVAYEDGIGA